MPTNLELMDRFDNVELNKISAHLLSRLVAHYRGGYNNHTLGMMIHEISEVFEELNMPCLVPYHQMQDQDKPYHNEMINEILKLHQIDEDFTKWTEGEKIIIKIALPYKVDFARDYDRRHKK